MNYHRQRHTFMQAKPGYKSTLAFLFALIILAIVLGVSYFIVVPEKVAGLGMLLFRGELKQIISPRKGTIISWHKEEGDTIRIGDVLATMINHDTDESVDVVALVDGVIAEVIVFGNSFVERGESIAVVAHEGDRRTDLELTGFVSSLEGKKIVPGMLAFINPTITKPYSHGYLMAKVKRVGKLPLTKNAVLSIIKIPEVADFIRQQIKAEPFVVVLEPVKNHGHLSGYQWSGPGPLNILDSGVFADFSIVVHEERLLTKLIGMRGR